MKNPYGWENNCGTRLEDGLCNRWIWVQWIPSEQRGKHFEPDQETPHVHRDGTHWVMRGRRGAAS